MSFQILARDGPARTGILQTAHGPVDTPMFMPVGTQAAVKGLTPDQVAAAGAKILLGNTYHLTLRPGDARIAELGGLHRFMNWPGAILTDSGGFQIYSLAACCSVSDAAAKFRSHVDGRLLELSPEKAIKIQENLGSDVAMVLDECPPFDTPPERMRDAVRRTILWAQRCRAVHSRTDQQLFAIVQGGADLELRGRCAEALIGIGFDGYALGGFSVGESPEEMLAVLGPCAALLPENRPRYLMGVGRPVDLLNAVARGIDLFDCVLPTRNGRNAQALTADGPLRLRNARHAADPAPLEADCPCYCCRHFSRAYLHHLFAADEMIGPTLLSLHNITYYMRLMSGARAAIRDGRFVQYHAACLARWGTAA